MTGTVPRILRRDQLDGLRRAETVLREAEAQSQDTRSAAAAEARALLEQAQRRALKESARTASRLIARAEETARARLEAIARDNGLRALSSATNFVAIDCGGDGALARRVLDALADLGIFARMPGVAPMDRCIRVSCAPDPELDAFAQALPRALAQARQG